MNVSLLFHYRRTNTYALNVLAGAVESASSCGNVQLVFAPTVDTLLDAARDAVQAGRETWTAWTFYSPQFPESFAELARVKAALAGLPVRHLAGGVHATAEPEACLRAGFDAVAIGEGEATLISFLERLQAGQPFDTLKGIATLRGGKMLSNGPGERADLNAYPPCARRHVKFNPIEITRGCVYACKFCQTPFMFKARFRHRSVASVQDCARTMLELGYGDIRFITPTALSYGSDDESVHLDRVEELLAGVRTVLGTRGRLFFGTFPSEVRPEHVTPAALNVIKRYADNDNLIIGGQSGSERILRESGRGHSVQSIVDAVRITRECGLIPNVDFLFGLPGETDEDIAASLRLAENLSTLGARIHGHGFMPLPGTPYKNAPAGHVPPGAQRELERLASGGRLYGQWKSQFSIARTLADARKAAAR